MPDIPGNQTTTATIGFGGSVSGTLEISGDHDWYRVDLTAGQHVSVALNSLGLEDPYLRVYDASGNLLFQNDDGGPGLNSLLTFTASYTGVYYLDAAAWQNAQGQSSTGDYRLSIGAYQPPSLWTNDQISGQLTNGYWGGSSHRFNVGPGGQITVNLTGLTPTAQNLAREALLLWTDVIGVTFREVTSGGQITFDDVEEGAFADAQYSGGITTSAHVNVSTEWLTNSGTTINSYSFQTFVHEIGHALGLGHAGDYNGDASYPSDILYVNDSWATSVMSYFDQQENTYFRDLGFSHAYAVTPMSADIVAMAQLYGVSTTTRLGDTVYGFNSTANRSIFSASTYQDLAYTIVDSGGVDTLNYSGFSTNQRISLVAETFSNIGTRIGNVSIGRGTVIENAIGGTGNDVIIGNTVANRLTGGSGSDTLTGGAGGDTFTDTLLGLNGDTITDFAVGDRLIFTNATLASFTFNLSGSTLTYSGGSLTLAGFAGQLAASAAASGGVQLTVPVTVVNDARNDYNGDGRSDVLLRHANGIITDWLGQANGSFASNHANAQYALDVSWDVAATGDFNGDGRDDVLLRNSAGIITDWLAQANGGFVSNHAVAQYNLGTDWQVAGAGDFNGDGRDDVLLRNSSGIITDWLGQANGSFVSNHGNAQYGLSTDWQVAAIGDYNGDGRDDLLLRNSAGIITNWLGQANGSFVSNHAVAQYGLGTDWQVAGAGDFNGDGRDDVLLRNSAGIITNWLGQANGSFVSNHANAQYALGTDWQVDAIGDYNGDGRDDVLLRNSAGIITDWLGQANGTFVSNHAVAQFALDTAWQVHPDPWI